MTDNRIDEPDFDYDEEGNIITLSFELESEVCTCDYWQDMAA